MFALFVYRTYKKFPTKYKRKHTGKQQTEAQILIIILNQYLKKASTSVAASWLLNLSLNNREVVNNSAIAKVHLRKGFLIFM